MFTRKGMIGTTVAGLLMSGAWAAAPARADDGGLPVAPAIYRVVEQPVPGELIPGDVSQSDPSAGALADDDLLDHQDTNPGGSGVTTARTDHEGVYAHVGLD